MYYFVYVYINDYITKKLKKNTYSI